MQKYLNDFFLLAEQNQWMYYYFSGFDTPYRKEVENNLKTVEAFFGLFSVGAKLNKPFEQLVINGTSGEDGPVTNVTKVTSAPTPAPTSGGTRSMTTNFLFVVLATFIGAAAALIDFS